MSTFKMAPELEQRARKLINKHHRHLADVEIVYVWRAKATLSAGSPVLGSAGRISGRPAMLLAAYEGGQGNPYNVALDPEDDHHRFIIEVAEDTWLVADEPERDALLDHYLQLLEGVHPQAAALHDHRELAHLGVADLEAALVVQVEVLQADDEDDDEANEGAALSAVPD